MKGGKSCNQASVVVVAAVVVVVVIFMCYCGNIHA